MQNLTQMRCKCLNSKEIKINKIINPDAGDTVTRDMLIYG